MKTIKLALVSILALTACSKITGPITLPTSTGVLRVNTVTTGNFDPAHLYTVFRNGIRPLFVGTNASLNLGELAAGSVSTLELTDIPANCSVTGMNPVTVTVVAEETVIGAFSIACT